MSIPAFALSGLLPPFVGDPARGARSPFRVTAVDVVHRFATSARRCQILKGWLTHRQALRDVGMTRGYQWVCGSFSENLAPPREPSDIDVVTFWTPPPGIDHVQYQSGLLSTHRHLIDPRQTKQQYLCDAYFEQLTGSGFASAQRVHYWYGLFSHRKQDGVWKGILEVPLDEGRDVRAEVALALSAPSAKNPGGDKGAATVDPAQGDGK